MYMQILNHRLCLTSQFHSFEPNLEVMVVKDLYLFVCGLLGLAGSRSINAKPEIKLQLPSFPLQPRTVHEFANPTWLENIAVRSNGNILATEMLPLAQLHQISDPESLEPTSSIVHRFPALGGLLGITEIRPDVFVIVGLNQSSVAVAVPHTAQAWMVDFTHPSSSPLVTKIADTPKITFPNGVSSLPGDPNGVLIADSVNGCAWHLDIRSGRTSFALDLSEMKPLPDQILVLGINGLHIKGHYLYWTNSFAATVYRVAVDTYTGQALPGAAVEEVTRAKALFLDDFATDERGGIYSPAGLNDTLQYGPPGEKHMLIAAGSSSSLSVAGTTALAFGRTGALGLENFDVLYATTNGGLGAPVNGTATEGGSILALYPHGRGDQCWL